MLIVLYMIRPRETCSSLSPRRPKYVPKSCFVKRIDNIGANIEKCSFSGLAEKERLGEQF
jgi:hypothetical protein